MVAFKRAQIAQQIAEEIGFAVLGKGVEPVKKWEGETDSYDIPPRRERAPEKYQKRAAGEMHEEYEKEISKAAMNNNVEEVQRLEALQDDIDQSVGLSLDDRFGEQVLMGDMDGQRVRISACGVFISPGSCEVTGELGGSKLDDERASNIFFKYADLVARREKRASDIWEGEKHILRELGIG
jgi:hypothetical protein